MNREKILIFIRKIADDFEELRTATPGRERPQINLLRET